MLPPQKRDTRKRKSEPPRPSSRQSRNVSREGRSTNSAIIDEDDGTRIENSVTPIKCRLPRADNRRRPNLDSPVMLAQLKKFCLETIQTGVSGLITQFIELEAATASPPTKTCFDANTAKNRYRDVFCGDRTRVILRWPAGSNQDYIHANWVDFKREKKFICTQAPIDPTIDDFWRLAWQEKCKAIVMLCELVEHNKKKCEAYWPAEPTDTMTTKSGLVIKNTQIIQLESIFTVTNLSVTCPTEPGTELIVKHLKWNNWPDRGVPKNRMAPFRLLGRLHNLEPVLIHCSAGIGRTGTIVGLYMALQVLDAGEDLILANVVKELRAQRHGSVQTDMQYVFMHHVLMNLVENKSAISAAEMEKFTQDYEAFVKSRGG